MAYEVTATRKRPQRFEDLVGQEFVVSTLRNAIEQGRIAHAYLFSGPRGVGKTTSARLLAKALNCVNGPTSEPCGECDNCRGINVRYGYGIPDLAKAMDMLHVEDNPLHADEIINVYPNPSKGAVRVALKEGHHADVTVYDFMGRRLYNYSFNGLNHTSLENFLNTLSSGVYFVNATSELGSQTIKVVLTR